MKGTLQSILSPLLPPLRVIFFILAAPVILLAVLLFFVVDDKAVSQKDWPLSHSDIQRARNIIGKSSENKRTIQLNKKDINIALSYLLNYYIQSASEISIGQDSLHFKIALSLNKVFDGKYLNFSFNLTKHHGYPVINSLQIGHLKIANEFAGLILENIINHTPLKDYYILAAQHIKDIRIHQNKLDISYITLTDISLKNNLRLNNKNYRSLLFYQQQITNIITHHNPKWRLSLTELLQPLFKLAYQRSRKKTAITENRIVLIAISSYVNKEEIQSYIPFDISPTLSKQYPASLYRRTDMAKHFMASAVLAATGAETLAHILGQEKELSDAKHGSGFSFVDLAGDKAGLRFGKSATASSSKARKFQQKIAAIKDYRSFMPEVRDLPENMSNTVFKQRFGSVYSTKYQAMIKKIDQRISDLPVYKQATL